MSADAQALVATEGLAVTARLMAIMSWLLDPTHTAADAPVPAFVTGIERQLPPVLAGTSEGDIALALRQLAAQIAVLAGGNGPGDQ